MSVTTAPAEVEEGEDAKKGKLKLVLIALVVLAVAGAATWFLVLKPSAPEAPKPGEVVTLDPLQVNLAAGHYLRIGVALQLTEDAHEVDGSKALDAVIDVFSGLELSEVTRPKQRETLRHELEERLHERYHGDVMEVYFTEFVTQ